MLRIPDYRNLLGCQGSLTIVDLLGCQGDLLGCQGSLTIYNGGLLGCQGSLTIYNGGLLGCQGSLTIGGLLTVMRNTGSHLI